MKVATFTGWIKRLLCNHKWEKIEETEEVLARNENGAISSAAYHYKWRCSKCGKKSQTFAVYSS